MTRLYAILARKAHYAVLFRRGPSRRVAVIGWDTKGDRFEVGQWLSGRIYERRCDLSPDGTKLVYFAAKYGRTMPTWTAISRPPYLHALAMFPKGDGWGGGGLFTDDATLALNHPASQRATDAKLPRRFSVEALGAHAGAGEDFPIWGLRLLRDGWTFDQDGAAREHRLDAKLWIEYDPPHIYSRRHPRKADVRLEMRLRGLQAKDGPWWVTDHAVVSSTGTVLLEGTDWADYDRRGDLLFSREGKLFRAAAGDVSRAREIADFSGLQYETRPAPAAARCW